MSYDLRVRCCRLPTPEEFSAQLAKAKAEADLEGTDSLDALGGALPVTVHVRGEEFEEAPEVYVSSDEPSWARIFSLSGSGDAIDYGVLWLVGGALAVAGKGEVFDPQEGQVLSSGEAWKRGKSLVRKIKAPSGKSAEERFVAKLRAKDFSERRIQEELALFRPVELAKRMRKEIEPLLTDPEALHRHLSARVALDEPELAFVLDRAWQEQQSEACAALLATARSKTLQAHAIASAASVGVAARVYVTFLARAGLREALDEAAWNDVVAAASSDEMREALDSEARAPHPPSPAPASLTKSQ